MLHELERSNFFLIPLDTKREWYRYHHLFGELLRDELALAEPEHVRTLHRRASAWHRDFGSPSEAIQHATAAGDVADASELILRHWIEFGTRLASRPCSPGSTACHPRRWQAMPGCAS